MLIALLIVGNIPLFLLLGWLFFDNKENAADTIFEALKQQTEHILLPRWMWPFLDPEESDPFATLKLAIYCVACLAAVYAEYRLVVWWCPSLAI